MDYRILQSSVAGVSDMGMALERLAESVRTLLREYPDAQCVGGPTTTVIPGWKGEFGSAIVCQAVLVPRGVRPRPLS